MGCLMRSKFFTVAIILQALFLILFGVFTTYNYEVEDVQTRWFYPMFQNVHVMMFIGFGFLMTFLKRYGYSAVSINFLIAALVLQWHILLKGLLHSGDGSAIKIGVVDLISADFTSAAVLISFGAVIGKTSPLQLIIMAFIEVIVFTVNEYLAVEKFQATDVGGSMVVHIFGAYFGLAVSRVIVKDFHSTSPNEASNYTSDIFSMIGAIFLWVYWPSFNAAVAGSEQQQIRAIINTYLALASCTVTVFALSSLTDKKARFDMVHVQNATLAGGVAVGTAANFIIEPWGACLIGCLAGILCVLGFSYIQPALLSKIGLHDSCGVHNLHGMPGVLAAIIGAVGVAVANTEVYGPELREVFPALAKISSQSGNNSMIANVTVGRTTSEQAGYQLATMATTLGVAILGGALTGLFLRCVPGLDEPEERDIFIDNRFFKVDDDEEERGNNFALSKDGTTSERKEIDALLGS